MTRCGKCRECGRVVGDYHDPHCRIRGDGDPFVQSHHCKMFRVIEWSSGFEVQHIQSGKTHWMGDGVDTLFDENDKAMSPGTEGFIEYWENSLNENSEETLEAYFPDLVN